MTFHLITVLDAHSHTPDPEMTPSPVCSIANMDDAECTKWKQCCYAAQTCCTGMLEEQQRGASFCIRGVCRSHFCCYLTLSAGRKQLTGFRVALKSPFLHVAMITVWKKIIFRHLLEDYSIDSQCKIKIFSEYRYSSIS